MKILKNFLKKEDFLEIKKVICGDYFPWYYNDAVNYNGDNMFQFTHAFYKDNNVYSDFFKILFPILNIIKPFSIVRIKANLLTKTEKIIEHGMHVDFNEKNLKTAIFYCNTNNGYTKFENGKIIKSEENKMVIFNCKEKHTGSTCTDKKNRIVINFNYFEYD